MNTRRRSTTRRRSIRTLIAGLLVGILAVPLAAMPAQAQYAAQGSGRFTDSVFWFEWAAVPNTGSTQTNTTTILGQAFAVTCSISNMSRLRGTGDGDWLAPYRPGGYSGDMLDDLYNRGGTGAANTMPIGLFTQQANSIEFDFGCSATLGGNPFPLQGLVMADAESTAPNELIAASIAPTGTWRVIDRARSASCAANSILASRTLTETANRLSLTSSGECTTGSPVNVAFMDGVTAASDVTVTGNGREAIALGVVGSFEGSDAPASYGSASHGMGTQFTGGEIATGPAVRTNDTGFALAQTVLPSPRLGANIDPDVQPYTSADAGADDRDVQAAHGNADDEDAFSATTPITAVPGQPYRMTVPCVGTGTVAGWIDWDRNGTFDTDERAQAACAAGSAAPSWTVPADAASTPTGANSFLRLRAASNPGDITTPTGVAASGEVEDHALRVVVPQPTANPDVRTTPFETPLSAAVLGNDVAGGSPFTPGSVRLLQGTTPVTTLTTAQGTYTVDTTTGAITFAPAPLFVGATPAVPYRVTDEAGRSVSSTLTVTVLAPPPPGAVDDATTGTQGATQRINPLANDTPGTASVPLNPSTLSLLDDSGAPVASLTVPGQGVYTLDAGAIVFAPEPSFVGTASGVRYWVADARGVRTSARYEPTVTGVAVDDASSGLQGAPQRIEVLVNDATAGIPLNPSTLELIDPTSGDPVSSVTVENEGVWSVDGGAVVFTPEPAFFGSATPLEYRLLSSAGNPIQATITVTVAAVAPIANADSTSGPQGVVQSVDPLQNDRAGDPAVPLDAASLTLLNGAGDPVSTLAVTGGTYSVAGATLSFTPDATFTGIAPSVAYRITDVNGTSATSTYGAVVRPVTPIARGDVSEGAQGATQRIDPLANDASGDPAVALDPSTLTLLDADGEPVAELTVDGVGTWSVDGAELVFVPEPAYSGTPDAVTYRIADVNGTAVTAPWNVVVTPGASPDVSTGLQGQAQRIDIILNDSSNVIPATLQLVDPQSGDLVSTVTVAGEGTYRVEGAQVVFTPLPAFRGAATPILYDIEDVDGNHPRAPISVTVDPVTPRAAPDVTAGPQGVPQSTEPIANDAPGDAAVPLDAATLTLLDADGEPAESVSVPGGEYRIDAGRIVFVPEVTFVGTAPSVAYRIADANGTTAVSTYTPSFAAVSPGAVLDEGTANQGTPVSVDPFVNDTPGDPAVPVDRSSLTLIDSEGTPVATLSVDGQGTYSVDRSDPAAPRLVFTPLPTWVGTADPARYRIVDANGTPATSIFIPTLTAITPVAVPDAGTARQGAVVSIAPLENDTAGDPGVPLDAASLTLLGPDGTAVTDVTIEGEGTYTVDRTDPAVPRLVFTPLPTWVGPANPVAYRVSDANGTITESFFTPTLTAVTPVPTADAVTGRQGSAVSVDPLLNDAAGDPGVPLVPTSLTLVDGAGSATDIVIVDGQGTYTLDRSNPAVPRIVFTPIPAFTGAATPVEYRVADANGTPAESTFTPTLTPVTPTAAPDVASARQGAPVSVAPLGNDTAGDASVPLQPGSLTLLDADGQPSTAVTIADQGRYTVDASNPAAPRIVFTPLPAFVGTATAVSYRVTDANTTPVTSTFTPTLTPVTPIAVADAGSARQGAPVSVAPLANDTPGDAGVLLDPSSLTLRAANGSPATEVVIAGQGRYTLDTSTPAAPRIVFTPLPSFVGIATAVSYSVLDANGTPATSTVTPTITPVTPLATPDAGSARQGSPVIVEPLANDAPGRADVPLDPASLTLVDAAGNPVTELEVSGQGTYSVDRSDADAPLLVFTPLASFSGSPDVATYRVADENGTAVTTTFTPTITAVDPSASPDAALTRQGAAVTLQPLANDANGDADVPLDPGTFTLVNPAGTPVTELVVAGQGIWEIVRSESNTVSVEFTPEPAFRGTTTPVSYRVADANGTIAASTLTVTVTAVVPEASADSGSALQGAVVSVDPLANDTPGHPDVALNPASLTLLDDAGAPVLERSVNGQGTYTVDRRVPGEPRLVFTPLPSFVGQADPVSYSVADANGTLATSTFTPTITGVSPVAVNDEGAARQGAPVTLEPLGNDTAGNPDVPLDPASLTLLDADGNPVTELTVAGQGRWVLNRSNPDAPTVTFTPEPTFAGSATLGYRVADANGTVASAALIATIAAVAPIARADSSTGTARQPQSVDPLSNDAAGNREVPLDPTTLTLLDVDGTPATTVTVPGEGRYTLEDGRIVFVPDNGFIGTATGIRYRVADANGTAVTAVYTPTVTAGPVVVVDAILAEAERGSAVTVDPSDTVPNIDPTTVRLIDPSGAQVMRLAVAGEGVWTVDAETGRITFTPEDGFDGNPTPIRFTGVTDSGSTVEGTVEIRYEDTPWWGLAPTGAGAALWVILLAVGMSVVGLGLVARTRTSATGMQSAPRLD